MGKEDFGKLKSVSKKEEKQLLCEELFLKLMLYILDYVISGTFERLLEIILRGLSTGTSIVYYFIWMILLYSCEILVSC